MRIHTGTVNVGAGWKPLVRVLNQVLDNFAPDSTVWVSSARGDLDYQWETRNAISQADRDLFVRLVRGVKLVALSTCEICGLEGQVGTPMVDNKAAMGFSTVLCWTHRREQVNRIKDARHLIGA